jgi:hypothetical protein
MSYCDNTIALKPGTVEKAQPREIANDFPGTGTKSRAADAPGDATRSWMNAGLYTDGRKSIWRITAIPVAAKTARHPQAMN